MVKFFSGALCALLTLLLGACSDRASADRDGKSTPPSLEKKEPVAAAEKEPEASEVTPGIEEIGEDCVGLLNATRVVRPNEENKDCPTCPGKVANVEVLKFIGFEIKDITTSKSGCDVTVEIRAEFNPSPGGRIVGGLIGWMSPEQREQYARGQTPAGPQLYKVRITYRRTDGFWRAVEFAQPGKG